MKRRGFLQLLGLAPAASWPIVAPKARSTCRPATATVRVDGWKLTNLQIPAGGSISLLSVCDAAPSDVVNFAIVQGQSELAAAGITLSGSTLTHDGRANVGTVIAPVQFKSGALPSGKLQYITRYTPTLNQNGVTFCNFGKHYSWVAGPSNDWYTFSGDGGTIDHPDSGGSAGFLRWNPSTPLRLDYWYPYYGKAGEEWPYRPDCYTFVKRSNGLYKGIPGYSGEVGPRPPNLGTPLRAMEWQWNYNPATNSFTKQVKAEALRFVGQSEQNFNRAIDVAGDAYYGLTAGGSVYRIDLATNASTYVLVSGVGSNPTGGGCRSHEYVFVPETNELFWLQTDDSSSDVTRPIELRATNVATGVTRRVVTKLLPLLSSWETGVAGMLPMVLVAGRRKIYIFYPEFRDRGAYYQGQRERTPGSFGPKGTGLLDAGIYEIAFSAGYANPVVSLIPYPQAIKDYAFPLGSAHDVCFFNAFYDSARDKIYAPFGNHYTIFEFGFA